MGLLVAHFLAMIPSIVAGTWKHSVIGLSAQEFESLTGTKQIRKRHKAKTTTVDGKDGKDGKEAEEGSIKPDYQWTQADINKNLTFDSNPHSFFVSSSHFRVLFDQVLMKFAKSLRNYRYKDITPHISTVFGAMYVGLQDSGIATLFPVRGPGRPPKHSQPDDKSDFIKQPLIKPPRLQSSDYPNKPISHVHILATDIVDEQSYVFVEWEGEVQPAGCWVRYSSLTPATRAWLLWDLEARFPCFDFTRFAPRQRCESSVSRRRQF